VEKPEWPNEASFSPAEEELWLPHTINQEEEEEAKEEEEEVCVSAPPVQRF